MTPVTANECACCRLTTEATRRRLHARPSNLQDFGAMTALPARPDDLPEYSDPPLVEVALTVGLEPLTELRQAHLGIIWSSFRDEFPVVQDHPARDPMLGPAGGGLTITLSSAPQPHLCWFLSEEGDRLIQIQADRFVANWRIRGEDEYPRFSTLFERFTECYSRFLTQLADVAVPVRRLTHIELVYVNWIDAEDPAAFYQPAHQWSDAHAQTQAIELERRSTRILKIIHGGVDQGDVEAALFRGPAPMGHPQAGKPGWLLQLVHRAPGPAETVELPTNAYWNGRNAIVRAFHLLTTPEYHDIWGTR